MKCNEILCESVLKEAVGRDLQHVEDIIYIYGPQDALKAVTRLQQLGQDSKSMTIKWDGSPAVTFGRDEQGRFHYGDKHSKTLNLTSDDIAQQVLNRAYKGKGDPVVDAQRKSYAQTQSMLWQFYKEATPANFRGFVDGDLMWAQRPQLVKGEYVVAPNTVQYYIAANSPLGKAISTSETGVAIHFYRPTIESPSQPLTSEILNMLGSQQVVVLGPKAATEAQANVDPTQLTALTKYIQQTAQPVTDFLAPVPGLTSVAADIYKYINSNQGEATVQHFMQWCQQNLTASKAAKIAGKNQQGLEAIFKIMHAFVHIKNNIINQIEGPGLAGLGARATLKNINVPGGEGLVDTGSEQPMKFVNRATFSQANKR